MNQPITSKKYFYISTIILLLVIIILVSISLVSNSKIANVLQKNDKISEEKQVQTIQDPDTKQMDRVNTPFFYTSYSNTVSIKMYDSKTNEIKTILENYSLYAAPEMDYDERLFVVKVRGGDSDDPSIGLYEFNVKTESIKKASIEEPFVGQAMKLSPNQTHVLALYDNFLDSADIPKKSIIAWNLLTGEKEVLGQASEGEYLSKSNGDNTFAGAIGFNIFWKDLKCATVTIYKDDPNASDNNTKKYKEARDYCIE